MTDTLAENMHTDIKSVVLMCQNVGTEPDPVIVVTKSELDKHTGGLYYAAYKRGWEDAMQKMVDTVSPHFETIKGSIAECKKLNDELGITLNSRWSRWW